MELTFVYSLSFPTQTGVDCKVSGETVEIVIAIQKGCISEMYKKFDLCPKGQTRRVRTSREQPASVSSVLSTGNSTIEGE